MSSASLDKAAMLPPSVAPSTINGVRNDVNGSGPLPVKTGVVGSALKKQYQWRNYTVEEVAQHSSADSMWVMIHGKVYDVHPFLEDHPGGPEILSQHAGRDATQEFEETFHSPAARQQLKDFVIGGVEGYDGPEDAHLGKKGKATAAGGATSTAGKQQSGISPLLIAGAAVALGAVVYFALPHFSS